MATNDQPRVAIIVLNYRMCEQTLACLASLNELDYLNKEVIVVDNNSDDGLINELSIRFPEATFRQTNDNLGYCGGNNVGIEAALAKEAKYVLILNPDTVLQNGKWLKRLVHFMESTPDVGVVGPRVFLRNEEIIQNTVLFYPDFVRSLLHWLRYRINPNFAHQSGDQILDAEVLNGVCILLRGDFVREVGLFDENIFMYIEDADLNYRAAQRDWRVVYYPVAAVIHQQKTSGYEVLSKVNFLLKRNSVYFLIKRQRRVQALAYVCCSVCLLWFRSILLIFRENWSKHYRFIKQLVASSVRIIQVGKDDLSHRLASLSE